MERPAAWACVPSTMRSINSSGQLRCLELGPGPLQTGAELPEHVTHAGLAAGKVIDQIRTHAGPAQPGSVDDGGIELASARDPVIDEVQDLAPQRLLQSIGQMSRNLTPDPQRVHADRCIE